MTGVTVVSVEESTAVEELESLWNEENRLALFARFFLKEWLRAGIGAMSKRETDVLAIGGLIRCGLVDYQSKVPLSLARELRITPKRLENLLIEAFIKYGEGMPGPSEIEDILQNSLRSTEAERRSGDLVFHIISPVERLWVTDFFERYGAAIDTSFSNKILRIKMELIMERVEAFPEQILEEMRACGQDVTEEQKRYFETADSKGKVQWLLEYLGEYGLKPAVSALVTSLVSSA